jgi:hypothetical protein
MKNKKLFDFKFTFTNTVGASIIYIGIAINNMVVVGFGVSLMLGRKTKFFNN